MNTNNISQEEKYNLIINDKFLDRLKNFQHVDFKDGFIEGINHIENTIPLIIEKYLETAFISNQQGYENPETWFNKYKNED